MKRTFKAASAALAAAVMMTGMTLGAGAQGKLPEKAYMTLAYDKAEVDGGWTLDFNAVSLKKVPEAKAAFKKAVKSIDGYSCKAVAVLGKQVVAGMNYAVLCRLDPLDPDGGASEIRIMYIYADLLGNAAVTGYKTIIGELLPGGFAANTGKLGMSSNKKALKIFNKAMKGYTGYTFKPYAYLGSQVVAGTNRLYLCRGKGVYPGAKNEWDLVTVYESLDGKTEVINAETLEIGTMDKDEEEIENPVFVGIANPWQEYGTTAEAAKAAGVDSFDVPEALGKYKTVYIQAMNGIAEVRYSNGKKEIMFRKGTGTDDISGDYNEYKSVISGKISGVKVTVKGDGKKVYNVTWNDGKNSYVYFVRDGIAKKTAVSHIKQLIGK